MAARLLKFAVMSIASLAVAQSVTAQVQGVRADGNVPVGFNQSGIGDPYAMSNQSAASGLLPNFPPAGPSLSERLWARGEYLLWWTDRMEAPPLVTGSPAGTPQAEAGVLSEPDTQVLFGGGEIGDRIAHGFRTAGGFWLTQQGSFAIEGEYFRFAEQEDRFSAGGDGSPIVGRPLFDITEGEESALLVSFPDLVAGRVNVNASSKLESALINGRVALLPGPAACLSCDRPDRVDWLVGFRHLRLEDRIAFSERLEELDVVPPGTITSSESFKTENRFNGLQLGVAHRANFRRAWLESLLRVAVGSNRQRVRIAGTTTLTEPSSSETFSGATLALPSNIGSYRRDEFSMIPELGLTLGIRVTDWLNATVGYSLLYFPNVVRAGDQIDRDVNPNQFAPPLDPLPGSPRPRFRFVETDYWAHGLNVGGEIRF